MLRIVKWEDPDRIIDTRYDGDPLQIHRRGEFLPCNKSDKDRMVLFICGRSGSGKSTYCAKQIDTWLHIMMVPDAKDVIFIGDVDIASDPAFRRHFDEGAEQINNEQVEEILDGDLYDYSDTMFVFDDFKVDTKSPSYKLLVKILNMGRKPNISALIVQHKVTSDKTFNELVSESSGLVFFPGQRNNNLDNFLYKHQGLTKKKVNDIYGLEQRRICLWLENPMTIIGEDIVISEKLL